MTGRDSPTVVATPEETRVAYGAALVLIVGSVVVSVAANESARWASAPGALQALALFVTLRVSRARRRTRLVAGVLVVVTAFMAAGLATIPVPAAPTVATALWALVVFSTIVAIVRHLSTFHRVDLQVVLGLLSIYVLLGLLCAYLFMLVDVAGRPFFTSGPADLASCVYFSYVTLATVGYGDLTAAPGLPRALAIAEAIIGQLYLVSVVALAVSQFSGRRLG